MRNAPALLLCALLVLPGLADAQGYVTPDAKFDEYVVDGDDQRAIAPCHDAAIDITSLGFAVQDGLLRAELTVLDLGSHHLSCSGLSIPRANAYYQVRLHKAGCSDPFLCNDPVVGEEVLFSTSEMGAPCGRVTFPDGVQSVCAGTFAREGNGMVWTLPVAGSLRTGNGDVRTYSMAHPQVDTTAQTFDYVVDQPRAPAQLRDFAWTTSFQVE